MTGPTREVTVARIRRHAVRVVLPCLVIIGCAGLLGFSTRGMREPGQWAGWITLASVVLLLFGLLPIVLWLRNRYTITTYRTAARRGLRRRTVSEVAHHYVNAVTLRQNWWQRVFGSGTIELQSVMGTTFELVDVPNAVTVTQALRELTGNPER